MVRYIIVIALCAVLSGCELLVQSDDGINIDNPVRMGISCPAECTAEDEITIDVCYGRSVARAERRESRSRSTPSASGMPNPTMDMTRKRNQRERENKRKAIGSTRSFMECITGHGYQIVPCDEASVCRMQPSTTFVYPDEEG